MLEALRADEHLAAWLRDLESAGEPRAAAVLPDADALPEVLLDLAVPHEDINPLVALRGRLWADPDARRLLDRCVDAVVRDMGKVVGWQPPVPSRLAEVWGELGRCFFVYVYVAALEYVRAYHHGRGIPDDVSRRTLADLGRHLAVHRRARGSRGLLVPDWLGLHFRGELYQLGRLQFQRAVLGERMGGATAAAGHRAGPGDLCLNVHITDFRGALTPEACDRSLSLAREFFARHFPEERFETAVCHSWLLDPQLLDHLPADSNIVRFQRRFRPAAGYGQEPSDGDPVAFVFGDRDLPVAELPRRTRVERAVGDHLRAGGHWYTGHGWFPL